MLQKILLGNKKLLRENIKKLRHTKNRFSYRNKIYCVAQERNKSCKKLFSLTVKVMLHKKRYSCRFKVICVIKERNTWRKKSS